MDKDIIQLKQLMRIDEFFPDIDNDLLALTLVSDKYSTVNISLEVITNLRKKYGLIDEFINYQSLEFYGDTVLSLIVMNQMSLLGLNVSPKYLTEIKSKLIKNDTLTSISRRLGVCSTIFKYGDYDQLPKHNPCADNIEAVLGALFIQYKLSKLERINEWFLSLRPVTQLIKNIFYSKPTGAFETIKYNIINLEFPKLRYPLDADLNSFISAYEKSYPYIEFAIEDKEDGKLSMIIRNTNHDITVVIDTVSQEQYNQPSYKLFLIEELKKYGIWI